MKRAQAAQAAADIFFPAEEAVFTALRDVSSATAQLIDLRRSAGFSPVTGARALTALGRTVTALHEGCAAISETHRELAVVQQEIGAGRIKLNGGGEKSKEEQFVPFSLPMGCNIPGAEGDPAIDDRAPVNPARLRVVA